MSDSERRSERLRRTALAEAVRGDRGPGGLARACLLVAEAEYPDLDAPCVLGALDGLGAAVRERVVAGDAPAAALRRVLATEGAGFRGRPALASSSSSSYDEPDNSFLNRVMERRRGLPILLSVVWIEVARAAGVPAAGVGLPGHFLARVGTGPSSDLVDPFAGGATRSSAEALALATRLTGTPPPEGADWLRPVGTAAVVTRILGNLVGSYERRSDLARLERTLGDHLALQPQAAAVLVRRGHVRAERGDATGALTDLNAALDALPPGRVRSRVHAFAARLAAKQESMN